MVDYMEVPCGTYDVNVKVVLVGDSGVGKKCFLIQWSHYIFNKDDCVAWSRKFFGQESRIYEMDGKQVAVSLIDSGTYLPIFCGPLPYAAHKLVSVKTINEHNYDILVCTCIYSVGDSLHVLVSM